VTWQGRACGDSDEPCWAVAFVVAYVEQAIARLRNGFSKRIKNQRAAVSLLRRVP
jgi:hypothetical protein